MRAFATYSNHVFQKARVRLIKEAAWIGDFDLVIEYTEKDIDQPFRIKNKKILNEPRGGGYWLWKPWVANRTASLLRDDDFLVYLDAGCFILKTLQPWFELAASHDPGWVLLEFNEWVMKWTKGDVFVAMGIPPDRYVTAKQVLGGVWCARLTPKTRSIMHHWLYFSEDEQLITDAPSKAPNHKSFVESRHDQSIFNLLVREAGVKTVIPDTTYPHHNALSSGAPISAARSRT